jgi:hypothetical protein
MRVSLGRTKRCPTSVAVCGSLSDLPLLIQVTILSACRNYVRRYSPERSGKHPTFFDFALWHATCAGHWQSNRIS